MLCQDQYLTDRGKSPMTSFDQHCLPLCTSFRLSLGWSTFFPLLDVIRFYSHLKTIFFLWLTVSTYMQSFGLLQKQLFGLHYIIIGFFCSVHFVLSNEILWLTVSSCLVYFVLSCTLYMQYFRWVSSRFVYTVHCTVSSSIQILQPPQCLLVRSIAFFPVQCNLANVGSLTRTRTCNLANVQLQVHTTVYVDCRIWLSHIACRGRVRCNTKI